MSTSLEKPVPLSMRLTGVTLLGAAGGLTGYYVAQKVRTEAFPWDDALASIMGLLLLAVGLSMIYVLVTRPASMPKGCGILQIVAMVLAGVMYLAPVLIPETVAPEIVMGGIVAALVCQAVANVLLWRRADEMLRHLMLETCAIAFWLLQLALFTYAAAERLGLAGGVSAWGMAGVMMAIYLIASVVASARKGLK